MMPSGEMTPAFHGKVALVTGAGGGIGLATAEASRGRTAAVSASVRPAGV